MISPSDQAGRQAHVPPALGDLHRGEYFAALFVLGYGNAFTSRIIAAIHQWGLTNALLHTFNVSVIIWISCIVGISLIFEDRISKLRAADLAAGMGFTVLALLPVGPVNWFAVSGLGIYIVATTEASAFRRGGTILFASTVPLLWSPLLFHFFSKPILAIDASLVSLLLGTPRTGTLVEFADHSGELAIFPACSSLANVSLAFLCWVLMSRWVRHKGSAYDLFWCLLACVSVIALNVARLGIYGLSKWNYLTFHSSWADAIDSTLITIVVFGISALGVRRELVRDI